MNIPKNLEECYIGLVELNKFKQWNDLYSWINMNEKSATSNAHFSLGRWIRNNWGLWRQEGELYTWFKANEINVPDDMSNIILTSFHRHMNKLEIKLEEQFDDSIEYYLNDKEKLLRQRKRKLNKIEDAH